MLAGQRQLLARLCLCEAALIIDLRVCGKVAAYDLGPGSWAHVQVALLCATTQTEQA
jgi:hypothetical protein